MIQPGMERMDLHGWQDVTGMNGVNRERDKDEQWAVFTDFMGEFLACLEDAAVRWPNAERCETLMTRAEHLMRGYVGIGHELLRPMQENLAAILHQVHRAHRRWTIRRYLTDENSVYPNELVKALELLPTNTPELKAEFEEDLDRAEAVVKDPTLKLVDDVMARAKAIALAPLRRPRARKTF
jgi:hypothetical protein